MFNSSTLFRLYLFLLHDRPDLVEYCIKRGMLMHNVCKYVKKTHQKTLNSFPEYSHRGSCTLTVDNIGRVYKVRNIDTTTWHKFFLLVCFRSRNGFWQLRVMLAEFEGQLGVRSVLFGWNSRLHGAYSFPPQCGESFSAQTDAKNIHQNPSNRHCSSWQCPARTSFHSTLLCVSHIWQFSEVHIHLSHFCCSQYPSSQRVMSAEVKFLPQIKWSEMKMLPQRVLRLVTLMETGPLAGLAGVPHFPKTGTQLDCIQ